MTTSFDFKNTLVHQRPVADTVVIDFQDTRDSGALTGADKIARFAGGGTVELARVTRTVEKLRAENIPVPSELASAVDNVNRATKMSPEPKMPDITLTGEKFDRAVAAWLAEHATWNAGQPSRDALFRALVVQAQKSMSRGTDEVLAAVAERFATAATEYTECHRQLNGLLTISDAAEADSDGRAVSFWHARIRTYRMMKLCEDILRPLLSLSVVSFGEFERLALVSPMPASYRATVHNDARAIFDNDKMYRAILDAGQTIKLASTRAEFTERVGEDVEIDDESDDQ